MAAMKLSSRVGTMQVSKAFRGTAVVSRAAVARPVRSVTVFAAEKWYPGATSPKHLDGSMLGDYGFDPLRIGANPTYLPYLREAELTNGRWAMAAVAGILFTDFFGIGTPFWETGAKVSLPLPLSTLVLVEIALFAFLEGKRYEGFKKTGETGVAFFFPFDPMGMKSEDTKLKELKNGRLAMLAFLGFCSQGAVRGLGPIDCLKLHLEDPGKNNIFTSAVGGEATAAVIALAIAPIIIEAKNNLSKDSEEEFRPIPW